MKKKILIVDDEPSITQIVQAILEGTGQFEVRQENRGRRALDVAAAFRPDMILLDIIMPDLEGSEVAAQLAADARTCHIPIIFLTAAIRKEEEQAAGGVIGGHPFVAKPFKTEDLIKRIEQELSSKR